jgi:hypothetical protein
LSFWEKDLSRIVKPESAGKDRTNLTKGVVLAIRELSRQSQADDSTRDLAAFIALALTAIGETIDESVAAWEKRGYWVKAERFRMEWEWAGRYGRQMRPAVLADDWGQVAALVVQIAGKLNKIEVSANHRMGKPWEGAYVRLQKQG